LPHPTSHDVAIEAGRVSRDREHVVRSEQVGGGREQHPRVRVARLVVDRGHLPHLDDLARVHDGGPVTDLRHHRQIMGDEDHGEAEITGQPHQQLEDLGLHHHVERGGRLVGQEHLRLAGQRQRNRGALPHAARELVGVAVGTVARDADQLEQLAHLGAGGLAAGGAVHLHRLHDLAADRLHRVERVHGALEHHRDVLPAVRADGFLAPRQDVLPVQEHAAGHAGAGRQQPHQRQDGGRLAAAGLAHQAHPLARTKLEADPLNGVQLAAAGQIEPDVEILRAEDGLDAHSLSSLP
jgi:hypothetical protein